MPNEDKNIGGSSVLNLRIWWRHVKTLYCYSNGYSNGYYGMLGTQTNTKLPRPRPLFPSWASNNSYLYM